MIRPVTSADRAVLRGMLAEFYDTDAVLHPLPHPYHDAALDELFPPGQPAARLPCSSRTARLRAMACSRSNIPTRRAGWSCGWRSCDPPPSAAAAWAMNSSAWLRGLAAAEHIRRIRLETEPENERAAALCPYGLFAAGLLPDVPGGSNMIYLDNAATTRPCAEAVAAVTTALTARWGNPSAVHRLGIEAARLLRAARQDVAEAMGAETERVFSPPAVREADNWAIFSAAERLGKRGRHIVTTAVEHHAVLHPMQKLEQQGFFRHLSAAGRGGPREPRGSAGSPPAGYDPRQHHDGEQRIRRGHAH